MSKPFIRKQTKHINHWVNWPSLSIKEIDRNQMDLLILSKEWEELIDFYDDNHIKAIYLIKNNDEWKNNCLEWGEFLYKNRVVRSPINHVETYVKK